MFSDQGSPTPPVAATESHLLDSEFDGPLDAAQQKHLLACGWCQQRADQAKSSPVLTDGEAFLAAARARLTSEPAVAIKRLTTLGPALHKLVTTSDVRDDVQPGQLWRLRWDDTVEFAMVMAIDTWWVTIAPVTSELAAADAYSPLLPAGATVLGVPMAVCVSLECVVPLFTFDQLIASAGRSARDTETTPSGFPTAQVLGDIWRAWRRGGPPSAELEYGEAVLDGDLDRRDLRNALATGYIPLVGASAAGPGELSRNASTSLSEMLTALGLTPTELSERTGLDREVFLRVKQGGRVTHQEAEALAFVLEIDSDTILAANPAIDQGLFTQVSRPTWRPALRNLARQRQISEVDQRWRIAEAVAAGRQRTTRFTSNDKPVSKEAEGTPVSEWEPLVRMRIKSELAELAEPDCGPSLPPSTGKRFDHGE